MGGEVAGEWTRKAIQMLSPNTTTSQPQEVGRERGGVGERESKEHLLCVFF